MYLSTWINALRKEGIPAVLWEEVFTLALNECKYSFNPAVVAATWRRRGRGLVEYLTSDLPDDLVEVALGNGPRNPSSSPVYQLRGNWMPKYSDD